MSVRKVPGPSRRSLITGLACAVLLLVVAACQAWPGTPARPTPVPVSLTSSPSNSLVWARVPFCNCLDGIATNNVSAALKKAQLNTTVKQLSQTEGWMYFVVAFDPRTASLNQITTAITAGGGEVVTGPP
jgi:hypothetical protein